MATYTVHEPPRRDEDALAHTARFAFVRDGFHVWAFLFGPLWMLRHRMWLETVAYLLLVGGLAFVLGRLGIQGAAFWVAFLIAMLLGIEASSLRRWKLSRRGFANLGVVVGQDIEDAERRFFDGWIVSSEPRATETVLASSPFGAMPATGDIVGLFPQPEMRR